MSAHKTDVMESGAAGFGGFGRFIFLLGFVILGIFSPCEGGEHSLFLEESGRGRGAEVSKAALPTGFSAVRRGRPVVLNPVIALPDGAAAGDGIALALFEDAEFTARVDRVSVNVNGTVTVRGRMDGYPLGYFLISTTRGSSLACVFIPETGERYRIQMDPDTGIHYVLEDDADRLDELEDGEAPIPADSAGFETGEAGILGDPLDAVRLDVMIVYTPLARQWADSSGGGIANVIAQATAKGQLALDNSNTIITLNLVHSCEVSYTESGDSSTDLNRLTGTSDGYIDSVHTLRDQYGADIVGMFTNMEKPGGIGWLLSSASGSPAYAFSISRVQQVGWTYTYIHEMGHNMGCHHHKQQTVQPGPGLFSYSAGWRWTGNDSENYCSVMTYESGSYFPDGVTHTRVAYFSDPDIYYQGVSTGDAADGDNARTLREIKDVVAAYRTAIGSLQVTISPQAAIDAGAMWRVDGGAWHSSGYIQSGLTAGEHTVEFSTISGWSTPAPQTVQISNGQTTHASGAYVLNYVLTVNSSGASGVNIGSSTGHGGTTNYTRMVSSGTSVSLTAPSTAGMQTFTGWTGDGMSGNLTILIAMNGNKTLTANYEALQGDLDGDEDADIADFALFSAQWLRADGEWPDWCGGADMNLDGTVDTDDLNLFVSYWLLN